jgi:hypothetical protein
MRKGKGLSVHGNAFVGRLMGRAEGKRRVNRKVKYFAVWPAAVSLIWINFIDWEMCQAADSMPEVVALNRRLRAGDLLGAGNNPRSIKSRPMPARFRLALLAASLALASSTAHAIDDFARASSRGPTAIVLCDDDDSSRIKTAACKEAGYDKLVAAIDKAFDAALAGSPVNVRPLLKRDQAWFNEVIGEAADSVPQSDDDETRESFAAILRTSQMHFTTDARDHVDRLQRERIALLEGFDDKRSGLAGVWLAHNAIIRITVDKDGRLRGQGWKWEQGDWKAGCDYAMTGKVTGGVFRSDEPRKNPDTLERDHATLIVNRLDDVFAKKREGKGDDTGGDEPKCKRNITISSTARLFPARPSPDIDNLPGSIR